MRCPPPQITCSVIFSRCLGEALRGSLHLHHHHAIVLMELIYYLDVLLDQEDEGRHRAERVQNSEVSYVRYSIGGAQRKFNYINRIVKRFRLQSTRVRRHTLPSLLCISMDRSLRVRRFFLFSMQRFPTRLPPGARPVSSWLSRKSSGLLPLLLYIRGQGHP